MCSFNFISMFKLISYLVPPRSKNSEQLKKGNKVQHDKVSLDVHMLILQYISSNYLNDGEIFNFP